MNENRIRKINDLEYKSGSILYWCNREIRSKDNWALLHAANIAEKNKVPLYVVYNLDIGYLGGGLRQHKFKLDGLKVLETNLEKLNIPLFILTKSFVQDITSFIKKNNVGFVVTDFSPLRISKKWVNDLNLKLKIPFVQVDAHNIVPVWITSQKQEFAAYTIRPKLNRLFPEYISDYPKLKTNKHNKLKNKNNFEKLMKANVDKNVLPVDWIKSGENEGIKMLKDFIKNRLNNYSKNRNIPPLKQISNLSPYFHYGMLSPQRAVYEVSKANAKKEDKDSFIEEAFVRRELSDNYCYYNEYYDSFNGFPDWAKKSLKEHAKDKREYIYTTKQFENAKTHDDLWNAAQMEMVNKGKMHGYMRMYWAKKILEWTKSPKDALKIAIYLNDKYELDGRDPNGYVGCAWSIGGLHDRAWFERPVFGKIRFMSYNGCKSKFDINKYIEENLN